MYNSFKTGRSHHKQKKYGQSNMSLPYSKLPSYFPKQELMGTKKNKNITCKLTEQMLPKTLHMEILDTYTFFLSFNTLLIILHAPKANGRPTLLSFVLKKSKTV